MKKAPGSEKRGESISSCEPYWYKKYGSNMMLICGPVMKKDVTSLQICGGKAKTFCGMKIKGIPGTRPL